jgi:two-component system NarL family sensor kinase
VAVSRFSRVLRPLGVVAYSIEAERIVAWLRLPAILLIATGERLNNPDDPVWYPSPEHSAFFVALVTYLALSVAVLAWVHLRPVSQRFVLFTAILDIAAITVLTVSSGGPFSESRLAYFIVPVVAAFRFRPAVTAVAGGAGIVAYLAQAFSHPAAGQPEATRFIAVHAGYLAWISLAAVTLSALLQRRTRQVWNLVETRESLLRELLTAEERERQTFAENLHDHAVQNLLSIRHELEEAAEQNGSEALERADAMLMETLGELRETVSTLHPYVLEEAGIAASLRLVAERAARRGGFSVGIDVAPGSPGPYDRLLTGAARELLANVAAHAEARRVTVKLSRTEDEIRLLVSDDGVGFEPDRLAEQLAGGHIGLASQRLRIESAGGRMDVVSAPGAGSTILIRLPAQPGIGRRPEPVVARPGAERGSSGRRVIRTIDRLRDGPGGGRTAT